MQILHGDNLTVMRNMPDNSVDAIVTDPPYGLSFMGKKWDYDVPSVEQWKECLRVLKQGGYLLSFAGTRTQHRMAVNIEDAGFEIRDMIAWVYGSGFPKSHNLSGEWEGWGTALKPALEPITVARKPLTGTVAENVLEWGTGAINIDGCRIGTDEVISNHSRGANSAISKGKYGDSKEQVTHQTEGQKLGRWPANLIHDGSEEVVRLFPDSKGQQGDVKGTEISRTGVNCYGEYGRIASAKRGDSGSAARFFYCARASKRDRDEGCEAMQEKAWVQFQTGNGTSGKASSISEGRDTKYRNIHPTVKPTDLMRYLVRLVTPKGGTVLDPWMGSGSTGKAAVLEGMDFIGIEMTEEYIEIAKARISFVEPKELDQEKPQVDNQLPLFD